MRCRYCDSENPSYEQRCGKCQRRLVSESAPAGQGAYPVVETATAPAIDYSLRPELNSQASGPVAVFDNPDQARRTPPAFQPSLFPRGGRKVIGMEEYRGQENPRQRPNEHRRQSPRRRGMPGQGSFDFGQPGPPTQPFMSEIRRSKELAVAPLPLRAMAAMFDACMVGALMGLFLLTVRMTLHELPTSLPVLVCYGIATAVVATIYKLVFCLAGQVTLGLQFAGLQVVSFDNHRPLFAQMVARVFGGWLSLASAGLGLFWAITDKERLTWHDHISQTFLTDIRLMEEVTEQEHYEQYARR